MNKKGLGKGLDALFNSPAASDNENVIDILIDEIFPNKFQPRVIFDDEKLQELAHSIKQYGILQPIVVRRNMSGYEIVAGERRWRAAKLLGLKHIPAVIREYSDAEMTEIALIENIQRQNLNVIEEAQAYKRLIEEFGLTQEEVALRIGRSRSFITNTIRLLNLCSKVQEYVSRETLTMGQVRPLLMLDEQLQIEAAEIIIEEGLSARDCEELVRRLTKGKKEKPADVTYTQNQDIFITEAEDRLKLILGTQVRIKPGKLKNKIEIEYYSDEDLNRIMEIINIQQSTTSLSKKNMNIIV